MKIALTVVLLSVFAAFSIKVKTELNTKESPLTSLRLGQPMPDFTLTDLTGKTVNFNEVLRDNKVVLINFGASWCVPCRMEMPGFEKLYNAKKSEGFTILAIDEDSEREKLDAYLKEKAVSFPVLIDTEGKIAKQFGLRAFPTTILVDRNGKILRVIEGVQPYLEYSVEHELREKKP
jgi:peroxiredoxin